MPVSTIVNDFILNDVIAGSGHLRHSLQTVAVASGTGIAVEVLACTAVAAEVGTPADTGHHSGRHTAV